MKASLIFTFAAAAASVSAIPATELTPRVSKRVCCTTLGPDTDPAIQKLMEQYGVSAANGDILGFGCRKLRKWGTCSPPTVEGHCDLDSYVVPHIYTSCTYT